MLMSMFAALALVAKPTTDTCRDDDGRNRCLPAEQERMRALYRVEPISAKATAQVRRIYFVSGYGRDTVALEFIRAAERSPVLRVLVPIVPGEPPTPPMEKELTASQWEDVVSLSRDFDKSYVKAKPSNPEAIVMCIHPWVYLVEGLDPDYRPRSKVGDACGDPPMEIFVWPAAKLARSIFPHCDLLDRSLSRNDATLLATCAGLTGDKITAARVFNDSKGFRFLDDKEGGKLKELSSYEFTLDLDGRKASRQEAIALWDQLFADGGTRFSYYTVHGLSAKRARVTGELWWRGDVEDEKDDRVADVDMVWVEDGDRFEVKSINVGAFHPLKAAK